MRLYNREAWIHVKVMEASRGNDEAWELSIKLVHGASSDNFPSARLCLL